MNVTKTAVLDQIILVSLDCRIWSGRKMLKKEDLMVQGALPPADLVSLGSKKIIDPKKIAVFNSVKRQMERACLEYGTRFLGGYAVPLESFDTLSKLLEEQVERGLEKKGELLAVYDDLIESWVKKHPSYEAIIRRAVVPPAVVSDRLRFSWNAFRVNPITDSETAEERMVEQAAGLGQRLLDEVAKEASVLHKRSFVGKAECTQKAINPIERLRKKMGSLAFVDTRIRPLCQEIDTVFNDLPKTGKLKGIEFHALRGLVELLSSEEKIREYVDLYQQPETDAGEDDEINTESDQESVNAETVSPETPVSSPAKPAQKPGLKLGQPLKGWKF